MVLSRIQFLAMDRGTINHSQVSKAFIPLRKANRTTRNGIDDWTLSSSAYIPYPNVEHPKIRGGNTTDLSLGSLGAYAKIFSPRHSVKHSYSSLWADVHRHQRACRVLHLQWPKCRTEGCPVQAEKDDRETVSLQAWRFVLKIETLR